MLFHFNLTIYNSAGEAVRNLILNDASFDNPAKDFAINTKTFAPKNGQLAIITAGGQTFTWAGDNDSAQGIENGIYYVKLEYTDHFGHVETMTDQITVLSSGQFYSVRIYNSAGEEVKQILVSSYGQSAPSRIDPDKTSIAIGQATGPAGSINFDLGNGTSVSWDGTNSQGQRVQSGSYLAQLIVTHDGAPKTVATAALTVLNVAEGLLAGAILGPNPLNLLSGHGSPNGLPGVVILKLNTPGGVEVVGRLYNMAGELVLTASNDMNPNEMRFDLGGHQAASGVYILAVTAKAPWGTTERKSFKLVILR